MKNGYTINRSGTIGSGPYFEVFKARRSEDVRKLAVKYILLNKMPKNVKNYFKERT